MVDSERLMRRKREEQLKKMREWEQICPNGFVDADVTENLTGRVIRKEDEDYTGGTSSLEQF